MNLAIFMFEDDFDLDHLVTEDEYENYDELDFSKPYFSTDEYFLSEPDFSDLEFSDENEVDEGPELVLDVPYVPTHQKVVDLMLDLADVGAKDVLYDLGCGDGRIVISAAMDRGATAVGVDLDPARIADAMEYAIASRVENQVQFFESDLRDVDLSDATVVTLYLLDHINEELIPKFLSQLKPGTRIVSHAFDMGTWQPDEKNRYGVANVFMWIVPAQIEPKLSWQLESGEQCRVELNQKYQLVNGRVWIDDKPAILRSALLRGNVLELVVQKNKNTRPESKLFTF